MASNSETIFTADNLELINQVGLLDAKADLLKLSSALRSQGHSPESVTLAISQGRLRHRALTKFGTELASSMLLTEAGLEQATRSEVANWHAERFIDAGLTSVTDLGCGIGSDSIAFSKAGLQVKAVEADLATAEIAAYNLSGHQSAEVIVGTAETHEVDSEACYLDPARRRLDQKTAGRVMLQPEDFSPNLNFAFDLASQVPAAIKLSGSFPHELIPANCEANWVSHNNELVETILFFGKLGTQGKRSAVLLGQENLEFSGSDEQAEIQDLGAFIYDPNPALVRSHLLGGFASENNLWGLSKSIAFLSSNSEIHSPWLRGFKVLEVLSLDPKRISKRLQELGIGILEIKKRGVDTTPEELRKKLRLKGKVSATLILTKLGEDRRAILCQPIG